VIGKEVGAVIVKARTLLLMCGVSLAGATAAQPIPPLHGLDGWLLSAPDQGHDLRRRVPHKAQVAPVIPLPRPRPDVLEETGAMRGAALNPVTSVPPAAPMPKATPLAAPEQPNASTQPGSALLSATQQGVAGEIHRPPMAETLKWEAAEPGKDNGGAAMPPVSVRDAGGGRVEIEAHDASLGQVLAALQDSGLIRSSAGLQVASDQLSRPVSGTYTGTLPQVLSRIFEGYSYFLRVTASGAEFHAVDASRDAKAALRNGPGDTDAALRGGPNDNDAASRSGAGSDTKAAAAPSPAFALSAANPVSKARARARAEQRAKTH
jgi:hypothetical protein